MPRWGEMRLARAWISVAGGPTSARPCQSTPWDCAPSWDIPSAVGAGNPLAWSSTLRGRPGPRRLDRCGLGGAEGATPLHGRRPACMVLAMSNRSKRNAAASAFARAAYGTGERTVSVERAAALRGPRIKRGHGPGCSRSKAIVAWRADDAGGQPVGSGTTSRLSRSYDHIQGPMPSRATRAP